MPHSTNATDETVLLDPCYQVLVREVHHLWRNLELKLSIPCDTVDFIDLERAKPDIDMPWCTYHDRSFGVCLLAVIEAVDAAEFILQQE
ncbi:hypothetical protein FOMG_19839 [Fusarium oxysporum f. sp. melonis 26406]|uniref:Uncharacterized protein n=1 Tax=Fusarium oxysporum f. sp. melonis 26406 TaxID=1089452 RepID=W9ZQG5_FUSOX|nr:hypothetical protein FOMG_19839 [Fusarium oxysporum f. sp. melonis 26406]KAJ0134783.1 Uncharacterized protein HZ326_22168 [Fusarium oxysporum f. sp. albedinis]KAK2468011.1 hypothetical protein H9L39_20233 [Fusarium oxysporum f. sp. albedinis]KAK2469809.1 hypothetical protein H9L39_18624 [Fusarium oxysporum f. sp. albedinis]